MRCGSHVCFNEWPPRGYPTGSINNAVSLEKFCSHFGLPNDGIARSLFLSFFPSCGQDGTDGLDSVSAAVVGDNDSVVLAGYTSGSWSGITVGQADAAAVKLDANGNELWRWQVFQPRYVVLAGVLSSSVCVTAIELVSARSTLLMLVLTHSSRYT